MLRYLLLASAFSLNTVLASPVLAAPIVIAPCVTGELIPGTTCTQECGITRAGGDYSSVKVASFKDCAIACNSAERCLTAQYNKNNGYCYLKASLNKSSNKEVIDGVVCRQPAPAPIPDPEPCPTKVSYTATGDVNFDYSCGLDYYGGDLRAVNKISTIEACLEECAKETTCQKVSWHKASRVCYLKNGDTKERTASGDWGAKRVALPPLYEKFTLRVVETDRKISMGTWSSWETPYIFENAGVTDKPATTWVLPGGSGVPYVLGQPEKVMSFDKYGNEFGHMIIPGTRGSASGQGIQPMACHIDTDDLLICTATVQGQSQTSVNEWIQCQPTNPYIFLGTAASIAIHCGPPTGNVIRLKAYRV